MSRLKNKVFLDDDSITYGPEPDLEHQKMNWRRIQIPALHSMTGLRAVT
jgi:hypothetical protein